MQRIKAFNSTLSRNFYGWGNTNVTGDHKKSAVNHHYRVEKLKGRKERPWKKNGVHSKFAGRDMEWRVWGLRCYALWLEHIDSKTALVCMKCGAMTYIQMDHVLPRSNRLRGDPWDPANSCPTCYNCNMEKGSRHGPAWDPRPEPYKKFQIALRDLEWEKDWHGKWIKKETTVSLKDVLALLREKSTGSATDTICASGDTVPQLSNPK